MKIKKITAINYAGIEKYHWRADTLFWEELPEYLLELIKKELPDYEIIVERQKKEEEIKRISE